MATSKIRFKGQGTLRKPPGHVRRDLERQLDAVDAMLAPGPFLLGDRPWLCDFALYGQLHYLSRTPVGAICLDGRVASARFIASVQGLTSPPPPMDPAR
jgi:glutathione S-transferase